ncbi:MAG: 3-beta hydroxysteroid dehydrogenase [Rhizobiales bacterium 62-17]|nr:SDR family oxidoreductase [Hyphomicrobiales bacterium]OJY04397.1 MAG: 3-beta hydroxysteroid dehydrogenase [Rhizobiales bacterium 62-17]
MRVFVTGATGFVGSAVIQELLSAGHQVVGLARTDAAARALTAAGAQAHRGDLYDPASLRAGAAASDGVVHTAFNHDFLDRDFARFKENCETERHAIEALGSALAGSDRPLIVTSGIGVLPSGRTVTEEDGSPTGPNASPRVATEEAASSQAARGVRVSVLRLPPSVHGDGDHGFVPILIGIARQKGASVYIGDGGNVWPAVHRLDAARLYRLALEQGAAEARYHAVAEEGVPFRYIAEVIGRRLNLPVVSKTREEAAEHFGRFAHFAAIDNKASSERTRKATGWQPMQTGLIADVDRARYFEA